MNVVLFGATGMIGQGVLRECLLDPEVERVLAVGRRPLGQTHEKLRELQLADMMNYSSVLGALDGYDTCFYCLGATSAGMTEADYRRVTVDLAVAAGRALVGLNPDMTFVFVSGAGTDNTGRSRAMWARVKGEAENAIMAMPFKAKYCFRPAIVRPMHGVTSRTASYRIFYAIAAPLFPVIGAVAPGYVGTTERIGRAMLEVAKRGAEKTILEQGDINAVADRATPAPR